MIAKVKTPCIGVCSTGLGDTICRGCKRFEHEVISWNAYSQGQKRLVINRLDFLLKQVMQDKFEVVDECKLKQTLIDQKIRFDEQAAPENALFTLLKVASSQLDSIDNIEGLGFKVHNKWRDTSFSQLKEIIDDEFFTLSCAHYERYFSV